MKFKFKDNNGQATCSSDFWYDIDTGGYIDPTDMLEDETQAKKVIAAVELVSSFFSQAQDAGHLEEM